MVCDLRINHVGKLLDHIVIDHMTVTVKITSVTPQFHRCHQSVIRSLGGSQQIVVDRYQQPPMQALRAGWKRLYDVDISCGKGFGDWRELTFPSEKDYMLWLIKWS